VLASDPVLVIIPLPTAAQVLNATEMSAVLASPYMFARKADPIIDARVLPLWDEWMARKRAGLPLEPPQAPIGHSPGDPGLSFTFRAPGLAPAEEVTKARRRRRVARIDFEDGSSCNCGAACAILEGGCCGGAFSVACAFAAEPHVDEHGRELPPCAERSGATTVLGGADIIVTWVNRVGHSVQLSVVDNAGEEKVLPERLERGATLAFNSQALHPHARAHYVCYGCAVPCGQPMCTVPCAGGRCVARESAEWRVVAGSSPYPRGAHPHAACVGLPLSRSSQAPSHRYL